MTETWAKDCARYEEGGAVEYLKAALEYEKKNDNGWSGDDIAAEVTAGGFPIHGATVRRRLQAVRIARDTRARANSKAFLEAFAEAYADVNARGSGGTPLDSETARRVYLEGVVAEFDRLFPEPILTDEERPMVQELHDRSGALLAGRRLKAV